MKRLLSALADGEFLSRPRVRRWSVAFLIGIVLAIGAMALTAHGINDFKGRPLGTDFSDVYAAGQLVLQGAPEAAFDRGRHYRQEQAIFGSDTPFYGWHYPPFFLVIAAALAFLPYVPALLLWQIATLSAYLLALRALLRAGPAPGLAKDPLWIIVALAFPAVFVNVGHGQNAFLTAALLAAGLALLDRRAWIAGICFGLLAYKPQFAILIPIALAAGGYWRSFASAAATVVVLIAVTTVAFGPDIWPAFFASGHFSRTVVLEQGSTGFEKIQSVFAAVRLIGGSIPVAYVFQGAATVAVAVVTALVWRSEASAALKGAALCIGVLLATPYCLDYDMVVLAPAIALAVSEGLAGTFKPGEKTALAALWLVPILTRAVAGAIHLPLGTIIMAACFVLVVRHAFQDLRALRT